MICPKCGAEILDEGVGVCPACGQKLNVLDAEVKSATPEPADHYNGEEEETMKGGPYIEPVMSQSRFYEKTWFIILALLLFWPLGLILMWLYSSWSKPVKIIVTILCAFALMGMFF